MADDSTIIRRPQPVLAGQKGNACLIVLSGDLTGRIYKLVRSKYTMGRGEEVDIKLGDDGVSRVHAALTRYENDVYVVKDNNSTNGTYVNGERIKSRVLGDGDRIQIGSVTILKFSIQDTLEDQFQQKLYQYATRDPLTHVYNKRFFREQLSKDFSYAIRHSAPLSLLMLDLDHFKIVNDTHGHQAGDAVLIELCKRIGQSLRNEDVLCRVGGEEFAIIVRKADIRNAYTLAGRLLKLVNQAPFLIPRTNLSLDITLSIGLATSPFKVAGV